jgi:hypothetical protein
MWNETQSVMMWWKTVAQTCDSSSTRTRTERKSGRRVKSNGRLTSAVARRSASRSRAGGGSARRSTTGMLTPRSGAMTCAGFPSTASKVVRMISWRRTISLRLAVSAPTSSRPVKRLAV